jgi:hypothetical protein
LEANYYNITETDSQFRSTGSTTDWSYVSNTPTTIVSYGITDTYTKVESDIEYASKSVQIGIFDRYAKTTATHSSGSEYIIGDRYLGLSARVITLSTASAVSGKFYLIQDEVGDALTNTILINTQGIETINGASSHTINTNYGFATMYSDGTNWYTTGSK